MWRLLLTALEALRVVWALGAVAAAGGVQTVVARAGDSVELDCRLDFPLGLEIPYHLQWEKDGEIIYSWHGSGAEAAGAEGGEAVARWRGRVRRLRADDGAVRLTAVRAQDSGLYRCGVAFPNRSPRTRNNGTFYRLQVDGGDLVAVPPADLAVTEGDRAELECVTASVPGAELQWTRESAALQGIGPAVNGSLVFESVRAEDAGRYECHVRAPDGREQTAAAVLDVHYAARVHQTPEDRVLALGAPASLDCQFSANPPLTNLRWEKDGFLFDPYNVQGVFYGRNGSLLFNRVEESHEGQYTCTAYNALGTRGPSTPVRIRVLRPPVLAARPAPLYLARLGASVTLPCAGHASPGLEPPPVRWTRNDGEALPKRHSVTGGNLTLTAVEAEDRGVYVCTVSNEAATVSVETELLVENLPPRPPNGLSAEVAPRAVHVSWRPGVPATPSATDDAEYTVWYREAAVDGDEEEGGEWRTLRVLSLGTHEASLQGLRPGARYEVRVLLQDRLGDGLFSKPLYFTTLADYEEPDLSEPEKDVPESEARGGGSDLAVTVRLIDEGALVRWNGTGGGCTVYWREGGRSATTLRTRHEYVLVDGLRDGATYSARVRCGRKVGAAMLRVPQFGRLRAVAAGCAGGALLLAALGVAVWVCRRPPPPPPRPALASAPRISLPATLKPRR